MNPIKLPAHLAGADIVAKHENFDNCYNYFPRITTRRKQQKHSFCAKKSIGLLADEKQPSNSNQSKYLQAVQLMSFFQNKIILII